MTDRLLIMHKPFTTRLLHKPFIGFWQPRKAGLGPKQTYKKIMHTQNHVRHFAAECCEIGVNHILLCRHLTGVMRFTVCAIPSVLWRCWLGGRKGIRPVKKLIGGVLAWLSVWSAVQTCIWPSCCHCHSLSLASVKSRWFLVLPFWYRITRVVH